MNRIREIHGRITTKQLVDLLGPSAILYVTEESIEKKETEDDPMFNDENCYLGIALDNWYRVNHLVTFGMEEGGGYGDD